jgi:NAD(P)H-flavin reductase
MDVGVKMPLLSNRPAIIIKYDEGGEVSKYAQREREWEAKGRRIIVRGLCGSACTL